MPEINHSLIHCSDFDFQSLRIKTHNPQDALVCNVYFFSVPSIVVDKGSQPGGSVTASHKMESQRSIRAQRTLSKQVRLIY